MKEGIIKADEVEPYIDERYWCETCKTSPGVCHPDTGMCYICGADDWAVIPGKEDQVGH